MQNRSRDEEPCSAPRGRHLAAQAARAIGIKRALRRRSHGFVCVKRFLAALMMQPNARRSATASTARATHVGDGADLFKKLRHVAHETTDDDELRIVEVQQAADAAGVLLDRALAFDVYIRSAVLVVETAHVDDILTDSDFLLTSP